VPRRGARGEIRRFWPTQDVHYHRCEADLRQSTGVTHIIIVY
jgi:hypothetical protein